MGLHPAFITRANKTKADINVATVTNAMAAKKAIWRSSSLSEKQNGEQQRHSVLNQDWTVQK